MRADTQIDIPPWDEPLPRDFEVYKVVCLSVSTYATWTTYSSDNARERQLPLSGLPMGLSRALHSFLGFIIVVLLVGQSDT